MLKRLIMLELDNEEEAEVVIYGIKKFLIFLLSLLVVLAIGIVTSETIFAFVFLIFYIPLRIYAGGFHLPKAYLCAITSSLVIFAVCYISKYNLLSRLKTNSIVFVSISLAIAIVFVAPVDTSVKRLYDYEKKRSKVIIMLIVLVQIILFGGCYSSCYVRYGFFLSLVLESIFIVIQKVVNLLSRG